jgi:hypothetical protein
MGNSSIRKQVAKGKVSGPGQRTGEGTDSLVRYLHEDLETKPAELPDEKPPVRSSIASRMKAALLRLR